MKPLTKPQLALIVNNHLDKIESKLSLQELKAATYFCCGIRNYLQLNQQQGLKLLAHGAGLEQQADFYGLNRLFITYINQYGLKIKSPPVHNQRPHQIFIQAYQPYRNEFITKLSHTLPKLASLSLLDLGCGGGELLAELLATLFNEGGLHRIDHLILVDSSQAMLEQAHTHLHTQFNYKIKATTLINSSFTQLPPNLPTVDITLSAHAFHHLPYLHKQHVLSQILTKTKNFILYELNSDEDGYARLDPHLLNSIYHTYSKLINYITQVTSNTSERLLVLEQLLMPKLISLCVDEYGARSEYHMLADQWHNLVAAVNPNFNLINSFVTADEITFGQHYQIQT